MKLVMRMTALLLSRGELSLKETFLDPSAVPYEITGKSLSYCIKPIGKQKSRNVADVFYSRTQLVEEKNYGSTQNGERIKPEMAYNLFIIIIEREKPFSSPSSCDIVVSY